jgi:hypothetical protein
MVAYARDVLARGSPTKASSIGSAPDWHDDSAAGMLGAHKSPTVRQLIEQRGVFVQFLAP